MKIVSILLLSLTASAGYAQLNKVENTPVSDYEKGEESGDEKFVITTDGKKISGNVVHTLHHRAVSVYGLEVDGMRVSYKDIKEYENESGYHVIFREGSHKYGPELTRVRKEKINFYTEFLAVPNYGPTEPFASRFDKFVYNYYFNKDSGDIVRVDFTTFQKAISDNSAALDLLKTLFPKKKIESDYDYEAKGDKGNGAKLLQVIDLYNN